MTRAGANAWLLAVAAVVALLMANGIANAQTVPFPAPPLANTITGTGAAARCALFDGTTSLTSDTGCTYAGTGSTFVLTIGGATGGDIFAGNAGVLGFTGRSRITSESNGSLRITNTTAADFNALFLGPISPAAVGVIEIASTTTTGGLLITSNTAASGSADTGVAIAVVGDLGAADFPFIVSDGGGTLFSVSGTGVVAATTVTSTRTAVAAAGGLFTCDFAAGPQNTCAVTLQSGANVATISNTVAGGRYLLEVIQPTGGADGTVTWPAAVHWPGAVAPVLTTTDAQVDMVVMYRAVTNLYAESSLNYVP